jgi:YD repeat-containing protein
MIRRNLLFVSLFFTINASWAEPPKVVEIPAESFAVIKGVNVRNGNFSVTYKTSLDNNDPSGIPFDRIYNSRSEHQGLYGLGWGTAMENTVSFLTDGDLVIEENGTGALTHYRLRDGSPGQAYTSTQAVNERYATEVENQARASKEQLRQALVKKGTIPDQGPIEPLSLGPIPERSVFVVEGAFKGDICRESSQIRREGSRMIRVFGSQCPTVSETYTLQGALVHVESRQAHTGASLNVTSDPKTRLVTSLTDEKGKVTRFRYDAKKRLVWQEFPSGETEKFEYDDHDNMTAIIYLDESKQTMTYDNQDRVLTVVPRRGPTAHFAYVKDEDDPSVSNTLVIMSDGDKDETIIYRLHN